MKYKLKKDLPFAKAGKICDKDNGFIEIGIYAFPVAMFTDFDEWFEPVVENKLFEQIKEYLCSGLDIGPKDTANTLIEKFIKPAFDAGWYAYASDRTVFRGVALDSFLNNGINGVNNE